MAIGTGLMERLGIAHPIIQAPMAGGATTPALVAAVSEAGGLGSIGATYMTPAQIAEDSRTIRERTSRPFSINLFVPMPVPDDLGNAERAVVLLAAMHAELGLPPPQVPAPSPDPFEKTFPAALDSGAAVFSFTFGLLPKEAVDAVKARGMILIGTATTVEEAVDLERLGVDAVAAQGSEAGAHRGTFLVPFEEAMVGTMALVPQVVDAVKVPVIAAGGIMDGRGIAAALALGASAVQMGTAFLTCEEAGIPEVHKEAILQAREHQTRVTRAFSGRHARGIVNRYMRAVDTPGGENILPFPLQNALSRSLRSAAAKAGRPEFLSLWAGQGVRLARRQSAAALMDRLTHETEAAIARLARSE